MVDEKPKETQAGLKYVPPEGKRNMLRGVT